MNRVVHFEIHAADGNRMQQFYQDVFGWSFQQFGPEMGNYRVISTGDPLPKDMASIGINGGMTERHGDLPVSGAAVNAYVCVIGVENIDTIIKKIEEAGGTLALAKTDVPGVGLLAYYKDPENNIFGILQPSPDMMPKA